MEIVNDNDNDKKPKNQEKDGKQKVKNDEKESKQYEIKEVPAEMVICMFY